MEIPYISLHDFAAINDSMRTRFRHFDPNFWQCVSGQINTIQPSHVDGWPLGELTIVCDQIQTERTRSTECSCVFHDPNNKSSVIKCKESNTDHTETTGDSHTTLFEKHEKVCVEVPVL